jgi:hypothetical protein
VRLLPTFNPRRGSISVIQGSHTHRYLPVRTDTSISLSFGDLLRRSGYMRGWLGDLGRVPNTICDYLEPSNAIIYLVSAVATVYVLGQVTQTTALRTYNGLTAHQLVGIRSSRSEECANAASIGISTASCYHHKGQTSAILLSSLMHLYDQRSMRIQRRVRGRVSRLIRRTVAIYSQ